MLVSPHKYLVMILLTCILANSGTPASNKSLVEVNATQSPVVVMSEGTHRNDSDSPLGIKDDSANSTGSPLGIKDDSANSTDPDDVPDGNDEQMSRLLAIEAWFYKFYFPTVLLLSGFGTIVTIVVLLRGAVQSSVSTYIMGIACANVIILLQYCFKTIDMSEYISTTLTWRSIYAYADAYGYQVLTYTATTANAWIVIALAVERLIAVYKPLKAHVICSESRAKKIVGTVVLMSILVNVPRCFVMAVRAELDPVTNHTVLVDYFTQFGLNPLYNKINQTFFALFVVIIPFVLLAILNILIIAKLRLRREQQQMLTEGRMGDEGVSQERLQIERVLVAIISAFLVCTAISASNHFSVALHGPALLYQFDYKVRRFVGFALYILNPFLNFVLYVCFNQNMRNAVMDLFCLRKCVYKCGNAGKKPSAEDNPSASITVT